MQPALAPRAHATAQVSRAYSKPILHDITPALHDNAHIARTNHHGIIAFPGYRIVPSFHSWPFFLLHKWARSRLLTFGALWPTGACIGAE